MRLRVPAVRGAATLALLFAGEASARAFHLDAEGGSDAADGLAPARAWKSLAKANAFAFAPGDSLLFKRGTRHAGQFAPTGASGTAAAPIFVGAYGTGARPLIEGEGLVQDAVLLSNLSYWHLTGLEITNLGATRPTGTGNLRRTGVRVVAADAGVVRGVRLRGLLVRDVNGSLVKHNTNEGHGILFASTGNTAVGGELARFDDLVIDSCRLERADRNGISQYTANGTRSTGVIVRDNVLLDIGGDGIKIWGSDRARIERNVLRGGRMRAQDHAAGMWPFEATGTVIQFNEVSGMRGTVDGMAFDADYRCDSTLIQYNYSYNNDGGFLLLCAPGNSYSRNTTVRYNISVNDGVNSARVIQLGGKATNSRIHNNTFYIGSHRDVPLIASNEWDGGNADSTFFYNNIFHVAPGGRVSYVWDKSTRNFFANNLYSGQHAGAPQDAGALYAAPAFAAPGDTAPGPVGPLSYRVTTFPGAGVAVADNGGRDFFGNAVPAGPSAVGAHAFAGPVALRPKPLSGPEASAPRASRHFDARGATTPAPNPRKPSSSLSKSRKP